MLTWILVGIIAVLVVALVIVVAGLLVFAGMATSCLESFWNR